MLQLIEPMPFAVSSDKKVIRIVNSLHNPNSSSEEESLAVKPENAVCQICFGTGTRLESGKGAAICDCRRLDSGMRSLEAARIPPRFRECSFHNYYPKNDSQYFAHSFASRLVDEYPAIETGLLFMGTVGVGKTHLAIAVLKELIAKKESRLSLLRVWFSPQSDPGFLQPSFPNF